MDLELTDCDLPTAIDDTLSLVKERAHRRGMWRWPHFGDERARRGRAAVPAWQQSYATQASGSNTGIFINQKHD